MKVSDSFINEQNVDWSLTTWEGARREQMRRWAELPFERAIMALEEMEELAKELQAAPVGAPMLSNRLEQGAALSVSEVVESDLAQAVGHEGGC